MRRRTEGRFIDLGGFDFPGFPRRNLRAFVPGGQAEKRPLLFVFDGQNAFESTPRQPGWHLHDAIDGLEPKRTLAPIVVAIPHGGATRQDELTPFVDEGRGGRADQFLDTVAEHLVPLAVKHFGAEEGPLGSAVGGASWGGLLALYAHYKFPHLFGGALCLSPSFWVGGFQMFGWMRQRPTPQVSRVYLDCGAFEAEGRMLPPAAEMAGILKARGYSRKQLWWRPDPRGHHTENDWRRRLPRAMRFMYRRG